MAAKKSKMADKLRRLVRERMAEGNSLNSIAAASGVDAGGLSRFLNRHQNLSMTNFDKLMDWLAGGLRTPQTPEEPSEHDEEDEE